MPLSVPAPIPEQEEAQGLIFTADKIVTVICAPVTLPGNALLTPDRATLAGYLLYRRQSGGSVQVWDKNIETWLDGAIQPAPEEMFYDEDKWQAILMLIGQKDAIAQTDKFADVPPGNSYFVRCLFKGKDGNENLHDGISPASANFFVAPAGGNLRASLTMAPDPEDLENVDEIRLYLKDKDRITEQGQIIINDDSGEFRIELRVGGTKLTLSSDGDIMLYPGSGRKVSIDGDVVVSGSVDIGQTSTIGGNQIEVITP